ncbi:MAG TPA: DedA family protein [Conexibacter sp.]|jgi:membrane protein DedA with SNARE-associated domain
MTAAAVTAQLTGWIADHGVYAVFALMALDALLPVGGELVMIYAGVLAAGAITGRHAALFGAGLHPGIESYVVVAVAGALGYLLGALVGWGIGTAGGRQLIERHGRRLHLGPENFRRAEAWFDRFGAWAVLLGRVTPIVRSFISIPAGVLGSPLLLYTGLTLLGSLAWCFGFAAVGWALGDRWESFHHAFRYADYAAVAAVLAAVLLLVAHRRRSDARR